MTLATWSSLQFAQVSCINQFLAHMTCSLFSNLAQKKAQAFLHLFLFASHQASNQDSVTFLGFFDHFPTVLFFLTFFCGCERKKNLKYFFICQYSLHCKKVDALQICSKMALHSTMKKTTFLKRSYRWRNFPLVGVIIRKTRMYFFCNGLRIYAKILEVKKVRRPFSPHFPLGCLFFVLSSPFSPVLTALSPAKRGLRKRKKADTKLL